MGCIKKHALLLSLVSCILLATTPAHAAIQWRRVGTVTTLTGNQLCYTTGTDVVCDSNAPTLSGSNLGIGSTAPIASLDLSQKTDAIVLPVGTTGTRPTGVNLLNGEIRYNSSTPGVEAYVNGSWNTLLGTNSSGASIPAAGISGQVQYNNGGVLAGAFGLTYAVSGNIVTTQAQLAADVPLTVKGVSAGGSLTSGMLDYYKFDEGVGTVVSDSAGSNPLTYNGAWTASGKINSAANFVINSAYSSSASWPSGANPRSLSVWVKPSAIQAQTVAGWGYSISGELFAIMMSSGGVLQLGSGTSAFASSYTFSTSSWTHVVGTYDGSTVKLYANGSLVGSTAMSLNTIAADFAVGIIGYGSAYPCNCVIDEVGIWNRALSQAEVTALYNSGSGSQYAFTNIAATQTGNLAIFQNAAGTVLANVDASGDISTTGTLTATGTASASAFIPTGATVPANGLYLPAANTLGFTANSSPAMIINSGGNVGIGTTSPATGMKADIAGPVKVAGTGSEACSAATVGAIRYNPSGQYMEICTYP